MRQRFVLLEKRRPIHLSRLRSGNHRSHIGLALSRRDGSSRRVPVDPSDIYFSEAVGDDTLVRLRSHRRL